MTVVERACRVCGCTDEHACPGGCYWVEPDLCSQCAGKPPGPPEGEAMARREVAVIVSPGAEPHFWMFERSGVLRPAVIAYLAGDVMTVQQIAAMRAYLRQWIMAPWRGSEIAELRAGVDGLTARAAIEWWLTAAAAMNIDPL